MASAEQLSRGLLLCPNHSPGRQAVAPANALAPTAEVEGSVLGATIHFLPNKCKASDSKHMLMFEVKTSRELAAK